MFTMSGVCVICMHIKGLHVATYVRSKRIESGGRFFRRASSRIIQAAIGRAGQ